MAFAATDVIEIGLRSVSIEFGGETFGRGTVSDSFHMSGI